MCYYAARHYLPRNNTAELSSVILYLVHVPAVISIFERSTDKYTHLLLELYLINTVCHSDMFLPSKDHTKLVHLIHSITWCVQVLRSPKEAFAAAMQSWREHCEKCACLQGDSVEKSLYFQLPVVSSFLNKLGDFRT